MSENSFMNFEEENRSLSSEEQADKKSAHNLNIGKEEQSKILIIFIMIFRNGKLQDAYL